MMLPLSAQLSSAQSVSPVRPSVRPSFCLSVCQCAYKCLISYLMPNAINCGAAARYLCVYHDAERRTHPSRHTQSEGQGQGQAQGREQGQGLVQTYIMPSADEAW